MPAEHQGLERQYQRLDAQEQCVDERECIDGVQRHAPDCSGLRRDNLVVVARIRVGDAAAARRHAVETAFVERLEKRNQGTRLFYLLGIDQLLAAAELAGPT